MVELAFGFSILKRAVQDQKLQYRVVNPRDFTTDKHRTVDDKPFGGGPGMLMKAEPLDAALKSLECPEITAYVFPEPSAPLFTQKNAQELTQFEEVVFVCGHYEGIDERLVAKWATHRFSIGDFVLTGGELPSLVMADSISRLIPGVLGNAESLEIDSHTDGLLSAPQYTRPEIWDGIPAPKVLLSGDHKAVELWKRKQALLLTRTNRPDLFEKVTLSSQDRKLLENE